MSACWHAYISLVVRLFCRGGVSIVRRWPLDGPPPTDIPPSSTWTSAPRRQFAATSALRRRRPNSHPYIGGDSNATATEERIGSDTSNFVLMESDGSATHCEYQNYIFLVKLVTQYYTMLSNKVDSRCRQLSYVGLKNVHIYYDS